MSSSFRVILIACLVLTHGLLFAQATDTSRKKVDTSANQPPTTIDIKPDTPAIDTLTAAPPPDALTHSDYIINGKVEDQNTGEGIPFATVFFPHTPEGTAADLNGNFVIRKDKLPSDTLRIQAVGYKPVTKLLRKDRHDYNYIIELERANAALTEVTIHAGEDPAVLLMRHIIEG